MPDADGSGGVCWLCVDRSRAATSPTVPFGVGLLAGNEVRQLPKLVPIWVVVVGWLAMARERPTGK